MKNLEGGFIVGEQYLHSLFQFLLHQWLHLLIIPEGLHQTLHIVPESLRGLFQ